jgi:transposase
MKRRAYRRTAIKQFEPTVIREKTEGNRLVLAIDVAKEDMVAALADERAEVLVTLAWKHLDDTAELLAKLDELKRLGFAVEAVMESTGTYSDVLRHQLQAVGIPVYQVSGKRVHDAKVVYDGVASLHDAKSSAIIAKLHVDGRSSLWLDRTDSERELKAAVSTMDVYQVQYLRLVHQMESWLARYWPEVTRLVDLTSATLMALLGRIGGPRDVAANPDAARKLMTGMSHRLMTAEKIEQVLQSATQSVGLALLPEERTALMTIASEAHRSLRAFKGAKQRVNEVAKGGPSESIAPAVGETTAAVLVTEVGDPRKFPNARAYLKAYGLNLKEKSSGKYQGRLRITKNGSGRARQFLWLAVSRWRKKDAIVQAWYTEKVKRDGGGKARAVTALMRKLVKALFHVARGEPMDTRRLFDTTRLRLET